MSKTAAYIAAAVVVAALGGTYAATAMMGRGEGDVFAQCREGSVAGGAIGGPFTLINEEGQTVTDADVITEPAILYFGYTFCPDVCPIDTMRNAIAVDLLAEQGVSATPVFITIDPQRDTTEVVGLYADNFHDKMIGLTGTEEQVAAASQAYRTYYRRSGDDPDFYLMDHSTFSYIVLPEHGFVDFIRREDTSENVAERVACFAEAARN